MAIFSPFSIPQVTSDPASPSPESAWVLQTALPLTGTPIGLLLSLTYASTVNMYQLSYAADDGTIVRTVLS